MKIFNKVLAILLAVITMLTMLPIAAIADAWVDIDATTDADGSKVTLTLDAAKLAELLKSGKLSSADLMDLLKESISVDKEALLDVISPSDILEIVPAEDLMGLVDVDALAPYVTLDLFFDTVYELIDATDYVPAYITYAEIWDYCSFENVKISEILTDGMVTDLLAAGVDPFAYCEDDYDLASCLYLSDFVSDETVQDVLVAGLTSNDPAYAALKALIPTIVSPSELVADGVISFDEVWDYCDFSTIDLTALITDAMIDDLKAADINLLDFVVKSEFYDSLDLDALVNNTTVKNTLIAGLSDDANTDYDALRDLLPTIFNAAGAVSGGAIDFAEIFDYCDFTGFDTSVMNDEILLDLGEAGVDLSTCFADPADPTSVDIDALSANALAREVVASGLNSGAAAYAAMKNVFHTYIDVESAIENDAISYDDAIAYCNFASVDPATVINDGIIDDLRNADVDPFDFCDEDYDLLDAFNTEAFVENEAVQDLLIDGISGDAPKYPDLKAAMFDIVDLEALLDDNRSLFDAVIPYCDFTDINPSSLITDGILEDMKDAEINLLDFVNTDEFYKALNVVAFLADPAVSDTLVAGMSGNDPAYAPIKAAWPDIVDFNKIISDGVVTPSEIIEIETMEALAAHVNVQLLLERVLNGTIPLNLRKLATDALQTVLLNVTEKIDRVEIDGTVVAEEDVFGTLSVDVNALLEALAKMIPTLSDLETLENNVVFGTNVKVDYKIDGVKKNKNVTFEIVVDGDLDIVRKLAGKLSELIDRTININVTADAMDVQVNVPALVSRLYLKAVNTDRVSDALKVKLLNLVNVDGNDAVGFLSDLTLAEVIELVDAVEPSKLYNAALQISYVEKVLEAAGNRLNVDLTQYDLDELVDYSANIPSFNRISEILEAKFGRDVAAIVENAAEKFDSAADRAEKISYVEKMLNLVSDRIGYDLRAVSSAEILDKVDDKPISETIANVIAEKFRVDVLAALENYTVDELYVKAVELASTKKGAFDWAKRKLLAAADLLPDRLMNVSVMEVYDGNGNFGFGEKRITVDVKELAEKVIRKALKVAKISVSDTMINYALSYITGTDFSYGFSGRVHFVNIYRITYLDKVNGEALFTAFLPVGADLSVFAEQPEIAGYSILGWADANGNPIEVMPAKDCEVYADYEIVEYTATLKETVNDSTFGSFTYTVETTEEEFMALLDGVTLPEIDGYEFVEWDFDYDTDFALKDLTIYAVYAPEEEVFTVTLKDNVTDETIDTFNYTASHTKEEFLAKLNSVDLPEKEGYVNMGWDFDYDTDFVLGDMTIYSKYVPIQSEFTATLKENVNDTVIGSFTFTAETTKDEFKALLNAVTLPEIDGYEFYKWDFTYEEDFAAENLTIYALYAPEDEVFTVTVKEDVTDEEIGSFNYLATTTKDEFNAMLLDVECPEIENYDFIGFDFDFDAYFAENEVGDITIYARYRIHHFHVTFLDEDGTVLFEYDAPLGSQPTYIGALPTKEGNSRIEEYILYWTKDGEEIDLAAERVTEDVTYQAAFFLTYHFKFNVDVPYAVTEVNGKYTITVEGNTPEYFRLDLAREYLLKDAYETSLIPTAEKTRTVALYVEFADGHSILMDEATLVGLYNRSQTDEVVELDSTAELAEAPEAFDDTFYNVDNAVFYAYEILVAGTANHDNFEGLFTIKMPFADAITNQRGAKTAVYVMNEEGVLEACTGVVTTNGFVTFNAPHFSTLIIANEYLLDVAFANGVVDDTTTITGTMETAGKYYPVGAVVTVNPVLTNTTYNIEKIEATINGTPTEIAKGGTLTMPAHEVIVTVTAGQPVYHVYYYVNGVLTHTDSYSEATKGGITLLAFPTDATAPAGYTGAGRWVGFDATKLCTADMHVYAAWDLVNYTVVFKAGEDEVASIQFNANNYKSVVAPTVPELDGYIGAWEAYDLAAVINGTDTENVDGTVKTVNAVYTVRSYLVFLPAGEPLSVPVGETVTLTLLPMEGYDLSIQVINLTTGAEIPVNGTSFVMPASNVEVILVKEIQTLSYTIDGKTMTAPYGTEISFEVKVPVGKYISAISSVCHLVSSKPESDGSRTYVYAFELTEDGTVIEWTLVNIPYAILKILNGSLYTGEGDPAATMKNVKFSNWSAVVANVFQFANFVREDNTSLLWLWILLAVLALILLIVLIYVLHINGKMKTSFLTRFAVWFVGLFFGLAKLVAALGLWILGLFGKTEEDFDDLMEKEAAAEEATEEEVADEDAVEESEEATEEAAEEVAEETVDEAATTETAEATEEAVEVTAEEATEESAEDASENVDTDKNA